MVGRRRPGGPSARPTTSTWTRWSSGPGSAAPSPPTGWPRRAARSSCSSAGRPTRPAASPAPRRDGPQLLGPERGHARAVRRLVLPAASRRVVSSGLGGGSLIYANVLLRKDEHWFVQDSPVPGGGYESWPLTRADLDPHYDRVEQMLGAHAVPADCPATTAKTAAMRDAAARLGLDWQLPPLAVTLRRPAAGPAGARARRSRRRRTATCTAVPRRPAGSAASATSAATTARRTPSTTPTCRPRAHHGADLRTRCEVRGFAPLPRRRLRGRATSIHDPADEGRPTRTSAKPLHRITCDRLVLGAGTLRHRRTCCCATGRRFPGIEPHARAPGSPATATCSASCSTRRTRRRPAVAVASRAAAAR